MTRAALLALSVLAIGACTSTKAITEPAVYTTVDEDGRIQLRVGDAIIFDDVRVRFHEVVSDNRCPTDVVCIQAGDAVVTIGVDLPCCRAAAIGLQLHTSQEPRSGEAYGLRVELIELLPVPKSTVPNGRGGYTALIRLQKL